VASLAAGPAALRAGPVAGRGDVAGAAVESSSAPPARSAFAAAAGGAAAASPSTGVPAAPVAALSYTSLQQHAQCGYRFYLERVLGLAPTDATRLGAGRGGGGDLDPRVRGRIVHALLERADFGRPAPPDADAVRAEAERAGARLPDAQAREIAELLAGFLASPLAARLASLRDLRREQRFGLLLETEAGETIPLVGVFDAIGRERADAGSGARAFVVDYKSDRLDPGADPAALAAADYALQRSAYALAALRDGAAEVEVVHCFLERPGAPASATYRQADAPALAAELGGRAAAVLRRDFAVAGDPGPRICDGCPGRGSLCSWPLERTLGTPQPPEGRLF
jgi:ATP-dependent helicase/nuclease subunit A